jgi:hypothetical protein
MIAAFPFERIETSGGLALSTWQQLKTARRGAPVVLGGDDSVSSLVEALQPHFPGYRPAAENPRCRGGLRHPEGLASRHARDAARARARQEAERQSRRFEAPRQIAPEEARAAQVGLQSMRQAIERMMPGLPATVGSRGEATPGLSVASNDVTGKPLPKVHIAQAIRHDDLLDSGRKLMR